MAEQKLDGGLANAGKVVRDGAYVLRPSSPHTDSIHAFLRAVDPQSFSWNEALADPAGGTVMCHNDVEPSMLLRIR